MSGHDHTPGKKPTPESRAHLLEAVQAQGGLTPGVAESVHAETGVPEAHVYGVASFYHLLSRPKQKVRVCQGLSCRMQGAQKLLEEAKQAGLPAEACSCLAACDQTPAVLVDRTVMPCVSTETLQKSKGDWQVLLEDAKPWQGTVGPDKICTQTQVFNLLSPPDFSGAAFQKAQAMGAQSIIEAIEASGLQGRGGAGFPAGFKWKSVRGQKETTRYVVLNADEGEPGTFKDREVLLRRPDLVLQGLAIAAIAVEAKDIYLYLRGEFVFPKQAVLDALNAFAQNNVFGDIKFHLHDGQGAYICGEETALLEALEGRRGMPRLKPPFPTESGLWGKPTLIQNVETMACVPAIMENGGPWFKALGKTEPGTKLYCVSGHVKAPGTYELPLGITLDELVEAAGGYVGELKAFSPGGASSGFLPASERNRPLDWGHLREVESSVGSAGAVVLNTTVNMKDAAKDQLEFYEAESCGQCAPCRIGTRFQRESLERLTQDKADTDTAATCQQIDDVAFEMAEGSICGLGQIAALPLTSAMKYFPEDFGL